MNTLIILLLPLFTFTATAAWSTNVPDPPSYSPFGTIDLRPGRQLFFDDLLIESSNLTRTWYSAVEHTNSPVLADSSNWAIPFSDGIWWLGASNHFRAYYLGKDQRYTGLAISTNGLTWLKPDWGISTTFTNAIIDHTNLVNLGGNAWR